MKNYYITNSNLECIYSTFFFKIFKTKEETENFLESKELTDFVRSIMPVIAKKTEEQVNYNFSWGSRAKYAGKTKDDALKSQIFENVSELYDNFEVVAFNTDSENVKCSIEQEYENFQERGLSLELDQDIWIIVCGRYVKYKLQSISYDKKGWKITVYRHEKIEVNYSVRRQKYSRTLSISDYRKEWWKTEEDAVYGLKKWYEERHNIK